MPVALVATSPGSAAQTAVEALSLLEEAAGVAHHRGPPLTSMAGGKWADVAVAASGAGTAADGGGGEGDGGGGGEGDAVVVKLGFSWEA